MARNHQRHAIGRAGASHGPRCFGVAHLPRQFAIAARLSARNLPQRLPHAQLKNGSAQDQARRAAATFGRDPIPHARSSAPTSTNSRERRIAPQLGRRKLRRARLASASAASRQAIASRARVPSHRQSPSQTVKVPRTSRSSRLCRPWQSALASCPVALPSYARLDEPNPAS